MIQPEEIQRDEYGFWSHSQYPAWDEGTTMDLVEAWEKENGIRISIIDLESDAPVEVSEHYFEHDDTNCSDWHPTHSAPGAFLLSIHDGEDGPVALFAIPQEEGSRCA